jgi:short subunit dehydrogenase-like uncharacterized protein
LATGTHYLDITGEPVVLEAAAAADAAGVMLLPATGFDAVPSDWRLPTATRLRLALWFEGPASIAPGTARTLVESAVYESSRLHRVDGRIVEAAPRPTREVDFRCRSSPHRVAHPGGHPRWICKHVGYASTGIPKIDVYMALSPEQVKQQDLVERMRWLLRFRAIRELVTRQIPSRATSAERAASAAHIWGEVVDDGGNRAVGLLHGPEAGLVWTSRCTLDVVLAGDAPPGHRTPATAYGPDLVPKADGVTREDIRGEEVPLTPRPSWQTGGSLWASDQRPMRLRGSKGPASSPHDDPRARWSWVDVPTSLRTSRRRSEKLAPTRRPVRACSCRRSQCGHPGRGPHGAMASSGW